MPDMTTERDPRYAAAAKLLGLPDAQRALQHSALLRENLLYVWEKPLGRTVIMATTSRYVICKPKTLLRAALERYDKTYPEAQVA